MVGSLAVVLIVLALLIVAAGWRMQRRTGLPLAQVVYTDTQAGERPDRPYFSPTYRLAGRPDYLLQLQGKTIPVEVKPSRASATPYPADILQLLAYCLLVEEEHGRPPYGLLRYKEHTFRIDYTDAARDHLLDRIEEVRVARNAGEQNRSHDEPGRCRACGYRDTCDQSLV